MISKFLFYGDEDSKDEKSDYINLKIEIRELLKENFNRKVLAEILLDLQKDVSGDARRRLLDIYKDMGLHLDAFKKLKSWRWEVISKGILELTQMQVEEAYGFIKKFINDKRSVIRKQAQIATVTLRHEGIAYFLDTTKYRISEWQQLKLLDVIRHSEGYKPPKFKAWLTSKNTDVVLFSLRLIKYYNQNDANTSIIQLVKHKNDQIKTEAINCIKEFCFFEALDTLKAVFWKCSVDVKLLVLDAIAHLGKEEDIFFLQVVESKDVNFTVKSKALSAINTISPETIMPTKDIEEPSDYADIEAEIEIKLETKNAMSMKETVQRNTISEENSNPIVWLDLLDPEKEDEVIFDICFMEELQDLLSEAGETEDAREEQEILPLGFLPIVEEIEQKTKENPIEGTIPAAILEIEVEAEIVSEDENFKRELEAILQRIREPESKEEESLEIDFLPFVVDLKEPFETADTKKKDTEDFSVIEVIYEEVKGTVLKEKAHILDIEPSAVQETAVEAKERTESIVWKELPEETEESCDITDRDKAPEKQSNEWNSIGLAGFSIFEELFRTCDSESKLILLDEVLAVGDEKELLFLNSLMNDEDKDVRIKAKEIAEQLQSRLSLKPEDESITAPHIEKKIPVPVPAVVSTKNEYKADKVSEPEINVESPGDNEALMPLEYCFLTEKEPESSKSFSVFDVDFEFEFAQEINAHAEQDQKIEKGINDATSQSSLLDSFLSIPVKIIEKLNG